jgi:dTDP-4-dehydrorhamnose 3,5-epimerase
MHFHEAPLQGAYVIEPERREDERGFFARTWCYDEFDHYGLAATPVQCNISFNRRKGTLRGMHFQHSPHGEVKLVRCTMGAMLDVIIDLRSDSPTFRRWFGVELSAVNRKMLYIPKDFAHGFLTLCDETEVFYQMSQTFVAEAAAGLRWNDPTIGIDWPFEPSVMSERDKTYPDFEPSPEITSRRRFVA